MNAFAMSVAGFDPSAGAGVLADVRTFERLGVQGVGVCSAITVQNEREFSSVEWLPAQKIIGQVKALLTNPPPLAAKIGLIENLSVLECLVQRLKTGAPGIRIIWDPIARASAGYVFHTHFDRHALLGIAPDLNLITPNAEEVQMLIPEKTPEEGGRFLSRYCPVYLKSARMENGEVVDLLFENGNTFALRTKRNGLDRHGTGCVFSSAVAAGLAKGESLLSACRTAHVYTAAYRNAGGGEERAHRGSQRHTQSITE